MVSVPPLVGSLACRALRNKKINRMSHRDGVGIDKD